MLDIQEEISRAAGATSAMRRASADTAVKAYFRTLGAGGGAATGDFEAARDRALGILRADLLSDETLALIVDGRSFDEQALAGLKLSFEAVAKPLQIPHPPVGRRPGIFWLALTALVGAAAGMFILAPLLRWAYEMRDLGFVLGGPLGAFLAVLVVDRLARVRVLLRLLPGVSPEVRSLSGRARKEHEPTVRACVEQWLAWAVPMVTILSLHPSLSEGPATSKEAAFRRIGKMIYALHKSERESLPIVADELIQEAKNYGFEGLDGPAAFASGRKGEAETLVWKGSLGSKYKTFGHIVEGDRVTVERAPVVFEGQVVERGLVRKVRE